MHIRNEHWSVTVDEEKGQVSISRKGQKGRAQIMPVKEFCALAAIIQQVEKGLKNGR